MSFEAKYGGECAACDHRIKPGQEVDYDADGDLVHVFCDDTPEPARAVCPSCFMELPVSGVCGTCDD